MATYRHVFGGRPFIQNGIRIGTTSREKRWTGTPSVMTAVCRCLPVHGVVKVHRVTVFGRYVPVQK